MHDQKSHSLILVALALVVLLTFGYVGAYALNVYRPRLFDFSQSNSKVGYRMGGEWSEMIFAPIHAVDRQVRHAYWNPDFDTIVDEIMSTSPGNSDTTTN